MHALLFAAGEGRRMRPLTQILPKPLIEVGGVPMAVRQILALRKAGITEIVVNAAHGARILMAELGDGRSWGVKLLWSIEGFTAEDALETRGGIVRALQGRSFSPPDPEQLLEIILDHRKRHFDYYEGPRAMRTFRKHLSRYLQPFSGARRALDEILREEDAERQADLVRAFLEGIAREPETLRTSENR